MIIPAILETDFSEIKKKVAELEQETSIFQIDVADGKLVDGKTFLDISKLDEIETEATFEVDLMVENPQNYVKERILSVFKISANIKAMENIPEFIQKAKALDYVVGISINLDTPIELIEPLLGNLDYVQFMDIVAGGQGRKFDQKVITKIKEFKERHPYIEIQVDGGIHEQELEEIKNLGIKNYVVGSGIFNTENPVEVYKKFKEIVHDNTNNLFSIAS